MKSIIKRALSRAGIYYAKRRYMPVGIDWLWDIHRLTGGRVRTVFDVGANVGQTTGIIKQQFPDAAVHAFEPVSSTYHALQGAVRDLPGVTCHRVALSDRTGQAVMTSGSNSLLNHLVEGSDTSGAGLETVETDTLDHFCDARRIDRIDILKVDAEGADLKVLLGGARLFREHRIAFVLAETGFKRSDSGHVHLAVLLDHFAGIGLEPYSFYDYCRLQPPAYETEDLGLVFANVLFVSPAAIGGRR
jgi:FkbM family methyltransferase